jgi:methyl-accepting chemotaxis protein
MGFAGKATPEFPVFNRLTVKVLLQVTLLTLAAVAIAPLARRAWDARLALSEAAAIRDVADASDDAFQVTINIRSDRNAVPRAWNSAEPIAGRTSDTIRSMQDREMGALRSLVSRLDGIEMEDRGRLLPVLRESLTTLTRLQTEFWQGISQPKASRRTGLANDYMREGVNVQVPLEEVSGLLFASIHHDDATVDQMMTVKQLAFRARDSAGDSVPVLSAGVLTGSVTAVQLRKYDAEAGEAAAYWRSIEDVLFHTASPPALAEALTRARQMYFAPEYTARLETVLATLASGNAPGVTAEEWASYVIAKLDSLLGVAQAALTAAKDRARTLGTEARDGLLLDTVLLLLVLGGAIAGILAVDRRVIHPLNAIRDAMSQLASGASTEAIVFARWDDEIGALATALRVSQAQAVQKAHLEQAERENRAHEEKRQHTIEAEVRRFEDGARTALSALTGEAARLDGASTEMAAISTRTSHGMQSVGGAAEETSGSVTGIAAASEQLSGSIVEIGRHVAHATGITGRAVEETRRTDATVRGLAEAAGRIGEVVKLINDIAGRTNLLALNATIEAARAGDAGKGFAVVASEVKSLANQTAKATEDIARQIADVQNVTEETVKAIRLIGTTIDEVNDVANSIASGVEQQGHSTQEIARNVQQAAHRTREMSDTVALVSRDARTADNTARDVKSASASMASETAILRGRVDTFLEAIRAA